MINQLHQPMSGVKCRILNITILSHVTRFSKLFETRGVEWSGNTLRVINIITKPNNI